MGVDLFIHTTHSTVPPPLSSSLVTLRPPSESASGSCQPQTTTILLFNRQAVYHCYANCFQEIHSMDHPLLAHVTCCMSAYSRSIPHPGPQGTCAIAQFEQVTFIYRPPLTCRHSTHCRVLLPISSSHVVVKMRCQARSFRYINCQDMTIDVTLVRTHPFLLHMQSSVVT